MKEYRQEPGGRRVKGDDMIAIQDIALVSEQFLGSYENFVISGCETVGTGISSGIVMLGGKACVFDGLPEVTLPFFVKKIVETEPVSYETGTNIGYEIFKAAKATPEEEGTFQLDNAPRFADIFKPKNAVNADTVDGKHANEFLQLSSYHDNIDAINVTGSYRLQADVSGTFPGNAAKLGSNLLHLNWNGDAAHQLYFNLLKDNVFYRRKVNGVWSAWANMADGGNADTVDGKHANEFLERNNGNMVQGSNIGVVPITAGSNAVGLLCRKADNTNLAGIGGLFSNGVLQLLYMGWGSEPWNSGNNFYVSANEIRYKNNTVWHAGNDGAASGLDADTVDGKEASDFLQTRGILPYNTDLNNISAAHMGSWLLYGGYSYPNSPASSGILNVFAGNVAHNDWVAQIVSIGTNRTRVFYKAFNNDLNVQVRPWLETITYEPNGDIVALGNLYALGFYQSSDERLKDIKEDFEPSLEDILELPLFYYTLKNTPDKLQIGTSAQRVMDKFPELVTEDAEGYYSVAYDKLAVLALKGVSLVYEELLLLKDKVKEIQQIKNL